LQTRIILGLGKRIERNTGSRCKDARERKGGRALIVFEID
jgi:hypothetical protein